MTAPTAATRREVMSREGVASHAFSMCPAQLDTCWHSSAANGGWLCSPRPLCIKSSEAPLSWLTSSRQESWSSSETEEAKEEHEGDVARRRTLSSSGAKVLHVLSLFQKEADTRSV